ncbi:MAG: hypothetical protein J6K95_05975 [Rikenellaceae bacterium]|nr:hypothetical protein [Rikenellaceae bacterium]
MKKETVMEKGTYTYRVEPRDVDFSRRATFAALGDYLLHTAGEDADRNGFGTRELSDRNWSWVLSRMAVETERMPSEYETLRITTWVSDYGRLVTTRNFVICDGSGRRIGGAVTCWAMIDLGTRTAVDLLGALGDTARVVEEQPPIERPRKIGSVAPVETVARRVAYSDIDFNRHVNTMRYLEWMFDMFPIEQLAARQLRRVDINFLHECRFGQQVTVGYQPGDRSLFEVRDEQLRPACRASVEWL